MTWPQIWKITLIYAAINAVHWFLHERFFTISLRQDEAEAKGWSIGGWDFLFYALFGLVVTSAVRIAGVLLVFSFLVIPAVIAFLFTSRPGKLLMIAWSTGTLATVLGLYVSYRGDLPTGPVVVCAFGVVLVAAFAVRRVIPARHKTETVAQQAPSR